MIQATTLDIDCVIRTAHYHAVRCKSRFGMHQTDVLDVRQDLICTALERWRRFDPNRASSATFFGCVIARAALSLIRAHYAIKRGEERTMLTDDAWLDSQHARSSTTNEAELRAEVRSAITDLSPEQQELCRLLSTMSKRAAARHLGLPRGRLARAIGEIRHHFEALGLGGAA